MVSTFKQQFQGLPYFYCHLGSGLKAVKILFDHRATYLITSLSYTSNG